MLLASEQADFYANVKSDKIRAKALNLMLILTKYTTRLNEFFPAKAATCITSLHLR